MGRLLARVLPLALGAAVNTRVFAVEVVLLTGPVQPLREGVAFGAGAAVPLLLMGTLDLAAIGAAVGLTSFTHTLVASAAVDLAAAAVLLLVALRLLVRSPIANKGRTRRPMPDVPVAPDPRLRFLSGAGVMASDISTMAMFVTAGKDIALARVGIVQEALVFVLVLGVTLVTAWGPPLLYATRPGLARRVLGPVGEAVRRHVRAVTGTLLAIVGTYLAVRGIVALS